MKTRKITLLFILFLMIFPEISFCEEPLEKPLRPFQLSIFPVIGTDGINSVDYRYNVSLNLFAGLTGGVEGIELGGFANITRGNIEGLQMAGFANIVDGHVEGMQASGFLNIASGTYQGIGMAGFANITAAYSQGIFGAGFGNFAGSDVQGIQMAGFMNRSGFLQGIQMAGFMNIASDVQGFQVAGFMNVASDVEGFQTSGFLNIAERVKGFQLGFINVADTISGLPVGFLSIVKNGGYRAIEVSASDAFPVNASVKIGVPAFYNIFSFATRPFSDNHLSAFGYGVGTGIFISDLSDLYIELHSSGLFEWGKQNQKTNQLSELRTIFNFNLTNRISLFAGPVLYYQLIKEDMLTDTSRLSVAPYNFYENRFRGYFSQWWLGGRAGACVSLN